MLFEIAMVSDSEPKLSMVRTELTASTPGDRQYALLIYADDELVAVLTRPHAASIRSRRSWILEACFGPCRRPGPRVWHDLAEFRRWVLERSHAARTGSVVHVRRGAAIRFRTSRRATAVYEGYTSGAKCTEAALEDRRPGAAAPIVRGSDASL
jgi:hypothetical protein